MTGHSMRRDRIGAMSTRITLQWPAPQGLDDLGGHVFSAGTTENLWARAEAKTAVPFEGRGRRDTRTQIDFTLRWRADVTRDCRVIWRGDTYRILSVADQNTQRLWLTLSCQQSR